MCCDDCRKKIHEPPGIQKKLGGYIKAVISPSLPSHLRAPHREIEREMGSLRKNVEFQFAVEAGLVDKVIEYLNDSDVDPSANNNRALSSATLRGHVQIVRMLYYDTRVGTRGVSSALEVASTMNNRPIMNILGGQESMFPSEITANIFSFMAPSIKAIFSSQHSHFRDEFVHSEQLQKDDFFNTVRRGKIDAVVHLLSTKGPQIDPSEQNNRALVAAAASGYADIVALLLPYPEVDPSRALLVAAEFGHLNVVQLILSRLGADAGKSFPDIYTRAIKHGRRDMVNFVVKQAQINRVPLNYQEGFYLAIISGYPEIVWDHLTSPHVDPAARAFGVYLWAAKVHAVDLAIRYRKPQVLEVLLADPRIHKSNLRGFIGDAIIKCDADMLRVFRDNPFVTFYIQELEDAIAVSDGTTCRRLDELILSKIDHRSVPVAALTTAFIRRVDFGVLVEFLERAKYDLSVHGNKLLGASIKRPTSDVTEYLLDKGATFNTLLGIDIIMSFRDDPEKVVKAIGDPRFDSSISGNRLIDFAIREKYSKTVQLLLGDSRVSRSMI